MDTYLIEKIKYRTFLVLNLQNSSQIVGKIYGWDSYEEKKKSRCKSLKGSKCNNYI